MKTEKLGIKIEKVKPQKSLIWDISDKLEKETNSDIEIKYEIENNYTYTHSFNDDENMPKIKLDIKCNKCGNAEEFELSF